MEFPTSNDVTAEEQEISNKIYELCKSRSYSWAEARSQKLIDAAKRNPFQNNLYHSHIGNVYKSVVERPKAPIQLGKRDRCFGKRN